MESMRRFTRNLSAQGFSPVDLGFEGLGPENVSEFTSMCQPILITYYHILLKRVTFNGSSFFSLFMTIIEITFKPSSNIYINNLLFSTAV